MLGCKCTDFDNDQIRELLGKYRDVLFEVQNSEVYEADDFTVVVQPFLVNASFPALVIASFSTN